MKFNGAIIKEQNIKFGIVVVKPHVLNSRSAANSMRNFAISAFGSMPIILMAQNSKGVPTYSGRPDIVNFLAHVPMRAIPWREYTIYGV